MRLGSAGTLEFISKGVQLPPHLFQGALIVRQML